MRVVGLIFSLILASGPVQSQPPSHTHQLPHKQYGGRCDVEIRRFCNAANLMQECLVAHWSKISNSCQGALAVPPYHGNDSSE